MKDRSEKLLNMIGQLPIGEWIEHVEKVVGRKYGFIHRSTTAEIHGVKGFLIWDYIIYNEITFKNMAGDIVISLYSGFSDRETETRWNELVKEYGCKNNIENMLDLSQVDL